MLLIAIEQAFLTLTQFAAGRLGLAEQPLQFGAIALKTLDQTMQAQAHDPGLAGEGENLVEATAVHPQRVAAALRVGCRFF